MDASSLAWRDKQHIVLEIEEAARACLRRRRTFPIAGLPKISCGGILVEIVVAGASINVAQIIASNYLQHFYSFQSTKLLLAA